MRKFVALLAVTVLFLSAGQARAFGLIFETLEKLPFGEICVDSSDPEADGYVTILRSGKAVAKETVAFVKGAKTREVTCRAFKEEKSGDTLYKVTIRQVNKQGNLTLQTFIVDAEDGLIHHGGILK